MNRTIKDATVKRYFYETPRPAANPSRDFVAAYNFARRLKTLRGLTPYEFICKAWTSRARTIHTQSDPPNAGTKHLAPSAGTLSLDREGFVLLRHGTAVADFYDDDQVERVYHPEIEALLRRPASRVHVDYSESSGPQRVRDLLGEAEAVRLADAGARTILG